MKKYFRTNFIMNEDMLIDREQLNKAENELIILKTQLQLLEEMDNAQALNSLSVVRSHINKYESITTAQIEGSEITDKELQNELAKTNFKINKAINEKMDKFREPINTIKVLKNFHKVIDQYGFGERSFKKMHSDLFDRISVKTTKGERGEFKKINNSLKDAITGEVIFEPAGIDILSEEFSVFEVFLNNPISDLKQAIINSGIAHAWFERIHPFLDGNGRVGRMIIPLYFQMNGIIKNSLVTLSTEFRKHQSEYYRALNTIQTTKSYKEWMDFYLKIFSTSITKINSFILKIIKYKKQSVKKLELSKENFVRTNKEFLSNLFMKRGIISIKWFEAQLIKAHEKGVIAKVPSTNKIYEILDSLLLVLGMKLVSSKPKLYRIIDIPQFII